MLGDIVNVKVIDLIDHDDFLGFILVLVGIGLNYGLSVSDVSSTLSKFDPLPSAFLRLGLTSKYLVVDFTVACDVTIFFVIMPLTSPSFLMLSANTVSSKFS